MRVALGSIFRNSTHYLDRYFGQARELQRLLEQKQKSLSLILVEGDSTDNSWNEIYRRMHDEFDGTLVKRQHGGPAWGSVDNLDRWKALSWCCNGVMNHVTDEEAIIYVESDLSWEAPTMMRLLEHLEIVPAVSPLCFTGAGHFYDTWGYAKNGVYFSPFPPYHPELAPEGLTQIDSAGSCIVMRGKVARVARFGPHDCVRGLGRSIYENGFCLHVDPTLRVAHL